MSLYIEGEMTLDQLATEVDEGWKEVTSNRGKLEQLEIYRAGKTLISTSVPTSRTNIIICTGFANHLFCFIISSSSFGKGHALEGGALSFTPGVNGPEGSVGVSPVRSGGDEYGL